MGVKVRQKTKGKGQPWWVFVSHNGRRTSRKVGSKKAALQVSSKIEAKLKLGEFSFEEEKPIKTFKEYSDIWIKTTVPATCKKSTLRDYQDILRLHVLPFFKDYKVTHISRGKVKSFLLDKMNKGKAISTIKHYRNCISGVLNLAIDDEVIKANPAKQLGKGFLKTEQLGKDINPLTSDELTTLLNAVSEHFPEHHTLFLLLARTGMRIGEALALKWYDIDFEKRFIKVDRSYARGRVSKPKSGKSRRVDMSMQLAQALKKHKRGFSLKLVNPDENSSAQYVFTNQAGALIDVSNWRRRVFKKAIEKAELRKIRIHDLRHTYATIRISKGDNVADVSNQLGHHSVKFTWDVYYHWMPGKKKAEVDALDDPKLKHPNAPPLHPEACKTEKGLTAIG